MRGKETDKAQAKTEGSEPRKKPGRQPMTAEEKAAAAKLRAEMKAKADNLQPEVFVQFQETEASIAALAEAAKADFHKSKKRTLVTDMKLYVKPEERTAYYIINGSDNGQISF